MSANLHNPDAERAVIGAVIGSNDPTKNWAIVSEIIPTPLAFFDRNTQIIVMVLSELWSMGKPIDPVSLAEGIKQLPYTRALDALRGLRGKPVPLTFDPDCSYEDSALPAVGGFAALGSLAEMYCPLQALRQTAQVLMEYYQLRQVIDVLKLAGGKLDSPSGRTELRMTVEQTTDRLIKILGGRSGTRSAGEAIDSVVLASLDAKTQKAKPIPRWPLKRLESMCRMRDGSMITLAGTSGGGKTSLAFQTAVATAAHIGTDGCVGFVSREMTADDLAMKVLSQEAGMSARDIEAGKMPEVQLRDAAQRAKDVLGEGGKTIQVCDSMDRLSHKEVCAWARSLYTRTGGNLRLLVVDHIGILDGETPKQNEYERQTAATRAFKALAMELRIVVLVLCQLNKAGQRLPKTMEGAYGAEDWSMVDLKGAGSVAHDADAVIFICKQGHDDGATMPVVIKIDKNRHGAKGDISAVFDKAGGQRFIEPQEIKRVAKSYDSKPNDREDLFHD